MNRAMLIRRYRCPKCGKIVFRESNKTWYKSYCETIGKSVNLYCLDRGGAGSTSRKEKALANKDRLASARLSEKIDADFIKRHKGA